MSPKTAALTLICIIATLAGLAGPSRAVLRATCSQAEKQTASRALAAFEKAMPTRQRAFFHSHRNASARKAFVARQRARLRRLKAAAQCAVVVAPPQAHVLATVPVGGNRLLFADGSLWIGGNIGGTTSEATVEQVDVATDQVVTTIPIGIGGGGDVESGFGSIWAVNIDAATVSRIDPASHAVLATIPTGGPAPNGIAFSTNAVWIANHNEPPTQTGASVAEIDPSADRLVTTVPVGGTQGGPTSLVTAAGGIWAFDPPDLEIVKIDPASARVVTTISSAAGGHGANRHFATNGTNIWFSAGLLLQRIDTASNALTTAVPTPLLAGHGLSQIYGLTYAAGSIWLSGPCGSGGCLLRVDPATDAVVGGWSFAANADADALELAYDDGSMWVSEHDKVVRLDVTS